MRIDPSGMITTPDQQQPNMGTSLSQDIANTNSIAGQQVISPLKPFASLAPTLQGPQTPSLQTGISAMADSQAQTPLQVGQVKGPADVQPVDISQAYSGLSGFLASRAQQQQQQPQQQPSIDSPSSDTPSFDLGSTAVSPPSQFPTQRSDTQSTSAYAPAGNSDVGKVMEAIGHFESGGNYKAVGPPTRTGDRALGKYQVMAANVPSWTKEALGKSYSPAQYLANPWLQDAVAAYKMGSYLKKYGNVGDVASVWFSGRPMAGNNSKDVIGTSVPQYVKNVIALYNRAGNSQKSDGSGGPGPASTPQQGMASRFPNLAGSNLPAQGNITTQFGGQTNNEPFHKGVDIANVPGTPVTTPVPGKVTTKIDGKENGDNGYGNSVIVTDAYGNKHRFSHLKDEWVKLGQQLPAGAGVGGMGSSGNAYSPSGGDPTHLDYRIKTAYGKYVNPMIFLGQNK